MVHRQSARSALAIAAVALGALRTTEGTACSKVPCFKLKGGTAMPQIAMGTWSGSFKDCRKTDYTCVKQHARFSTENWLHIGGRHIDGANDYRTQTSIAEALATSGIAREDIFLTTKCPGTIGYQATIQCADDNLQMLGQTGSNGYGYIDLLLVHFPFVIKPACRFRNDLPECETPFEDADKEALQETWRAMEELKRIGVVRSIGVSDYNITQLQQTLQVAKEPIEVHQVEWNPYHHEEDMLAFCKQNGIQLQAWSPLGGKAGSVLAEPSVQRIAAAHNVSTAQVVLRWSLQRDVAVVVGTANPEHQSGDIDLFTFQLSSAELDEISHLDSVRFLRKQQPVVI